MKIGLVISQTDPETVWNAFRLANHSLAKKHDVRVFLMGKGVECEEISHKDFNVKQQMERFIDAGGEILACGTCLRWRKKEGTKVCPMSTLDDLMALVEESDRVLTF